MKIESIGQKVAIIVKPGNKRTRILKMPEKAALMAEAAVRALKPQDKAVAVSPDYIQMTRRGITQTGQASGREVPPPYVRPIYLEPTGQKPGPIPIELSQPSTPPYEEPSDTTWPLSILRRKK